jgi:dihydrofolate reductase
MLTKVIAACNHDGVIGVNGKLPWHIEEDLKRFRKMTEGYPVVMGYDTWESLPRKPLPERLNCVLTAHRKVNHPDVIVRDNYSDMLWVLEQAGYKEISVIGGESVYRVAVPTADFIYLTWVDQQVETQPGDKVARFPIDLIDAQWQECSTVRRQGHRYTVYAKK